MKEYWIVQPQDRSLIIFTLTAAGQYQPSKPLTNGDIATSRVLPGLAIDLDELFIDIEEEPQALYPLDVKRI